jgi:hypothetical protein
MTGMTVIEEAVDLLDRMAGFLELGGRTELADKYTAEISECGNYAYLDIARGTELIWKDEHVYLFRAYGMSLDRILSLWDDERLTRPRRARLLDRVAREADKVVREGVMTALNAKKPPRRKG